MLVDALIPLLRIYLDSPRLLRDYSCCLVYLDVPFPVPSLAASMFDDLCVLLLHNCLL